MTDRTHTRTLLKALRLGTLLIAAGLVFAACGGGSDQSSVEQGGGQEEEQASGTTAAETTGGSMDSVLEQASRFPEAMQKSAEGGNQRFRGSQDVPFEDFVQYVINDSNAKWQSVLEGTGVPYAPTTGVLFEQPATVPQGCGTDETGAVADPAYGPFYCPLDQTVYWPTETSINGTPIQDYGDFAVATAAAHEVGHHVQQQLGVLDAEMNGELLSIQTELQADCFAGVWGFSTYYEGLIEPGDLDEAISLMGNIGDVPEHPRGGPGAHGTPEERNEAFMLGYDSGDPAQCLAYTPPPAETS